MAKKKKENNIWIWIGLIALIFLIGKGGFLGSVITTCENIEPTSLGEFSDYVLGNNDTLSFSILTINGNMYDSYSTNNLWSADMSVIDPGTNFSCSQLLQEISVGTNSTFIVLDKRQTLLNEEGYYWCNYNNNLGVHSKELSTKSSYHSTFEVCTSEEVEVPEFKYVANQEDCEDVNGIWGETCECKDGTRVEIGMLCEPIPSSSAPVSSTPSSGSDMVESSRESVSTQNPVSSRTWIIAALIIAIVGLLYWFFEKGPKNGLFKFI